MRQMFVLIACALACAGSQAAAQADKPVLDKARAVIAAKLKDPPSARFADLQRKTVPNARGEPTDVVCGTVSSKNSYGGYTGAKPFVYFVARGDATLAEGDQIYMIVVDSFCGSGKF